MTQVNIKRVYDEPSEQDGYRVLVETACGPVA